MIYSGEINYEKKYKEALEKARKTLEKSSAKDAAKLIVEYFFPELAESEDEVTRKWILDYLCDGLRKSDKQFKDQFKSAIAWLEKQKEQKPNIELIQRSWYMEGYHDREFGKEPKWVIKTGEGGPKHELNPRYREPLCDEQKPAEWSEKDKAFLKVAIATCNRYSHKDIADWLKSLPERLNFQPKEEWSEEDEETIGTLINYFEGDALDYSTDEMIRRIRALRPSWKPSEDEERLIKTSISFLKDFADKGYENAVECIDWLKSKLNGNSGK